MREWCRIVVVSGKQVLFVREYDTDEDEHKLNMTIHGEDWVAGCGLDATISLGRSDEPFTDETFNKLANVEMAEKLINEHLLPLIGPEED